MSRFLTLSLIYRGFILGFQLIRSLRHEKGVSKAGTPEIEALDARPIDAPPLSERRHRRR